MYENVSVHKENVDKKNKICQKHIFIFIRLQKIKK